MKFAGVLGQTKHSNVSFNWQGYHNYELGKPGVPSGLIERANSVISWSSMVQGVFDAITAPRSDDYYGSCDVVLFVGQDEFAPALPLIRRLKENYPQVLILGLSEAPTSMHRFYCRTNWDYQKSFYEFANAVDILITWHLESVPYYSLFREQLPRCVYFSHPYPLEFVRQFGEPLPRLAREKTLYKAGHIHGRPASDGFADVVTAMRVLRDHPEFKLLVHDFPKTYGQLMAIMERRPRKHRLDDFMGRGRGRGFLRRLMRRFIKSGAEDPYIAWAYGKGSAYPIAINPIQLRGFSLERVEFHNTLKWREILPRWRSVFAAIEMDASYTQGRSPKDAAAFGTPMIGTNSDFQRALFPELRVQDYDYDEAERLLRQLFEDEAFYTHVSKQALQRIELYSYERSQRRMNAFIGQVRAGRTDWSEQEMLDLGAL